MSEKLKAHGLEPDDESTAGTMPKKNMLSFLNYPGTKNLKFHNPDVSSGLLHSGFGAGQSLTSQVL